MLRIHWDVNISIILILFKYKEIRTGKSHIPVIN